MVILITNLGILGKKISNNTNYYQIRCRIHSSTTISCWWMGECAPMKQRMDVSGYANQRPYFFTDNKLSVISFGGHTGQQHSNRFDRLDYHQSILAA
ncbi:hypothetical protein DERF_003342 [Dermatophagoides farinae]|uniref:Uncharacterized protein n=1 Tax=Dermatophagoides farinae TaxID=6954 RepID=A0A922IEU9_DERFA|nr:hypothetical protein DERF_003342 [Dermatophagoides farinae]